MVRHRRTSLLRISVSFSPISPSHDKIITISDGETFHEWSKPLLEEFDPAGRLLLFCLAVIRPNAIFKASLNRSRSPGHRGQIASSERFCWLTLISVKLIRPRRRTACRPRPNSRCRARSDRRHCACRGSCRTENSTWRCCAATP